MAWSSPYTLTPSAINSWIGEEIRAVGAEAKLSFRSETNQLDVTGGLFGFNDAAGTLLAYRGFAFNDVVAGAFTQFPLADLPQIGPGGAFISQPQFVEPVAEIDNRVGFYGAVDWTYDRNWQLGAFYYDNQANPEARRAQQYGWRTKFWNFYAEGDIVADIHVITQYLTGSTEMGRFDDAVGTRYVNLDYKAGFILASKPYGSQRLSARFDWFDINDLAFVAIDNNNEAGVSFAFAHSTALSEKSSLILEYLYVDSRRVGRRDISVTQDQKQSTFQIAFRQRF